MICAKCHGSGEVYILGNFKLPCECQKPAPAPAPVKRPRRLALKGAKDTQLRAENRPQPTRKLFPPGFEVRFKQDYGGWKKGEIRTILQSGDCDPYPCPFVALQMDGDRNGRSKIIEDPEEILELLNPEG